MRNLTQLCLAVILAAACGVAVAQDGDGEQRRRGRREGGRPDRAGMRADNGVAGEDAPRRRGGLAQGPGGRRQGRRGQGGALQASLAQLELSQEQRARIVEILREGAEDNRAMREEAAEAFRAAREQMREARRSGDEDAIEAAREKMGEVARRRGAAGERIHEEISAVLTQRQRAKFDRLMGPAGRFERMLAGVGELDLEDAQRRQIREIVAKANADAKLAGEMSEKRTIYRKASGEVMGLLSDEQKAQLRSRPGPGRRGGGRWRGLEGLDLTDEQQAAVDAIYEEMRRRVEDADTPQAKREAARAARGEARRRIFGEVLTDEQKEQMREQFKERRRGRGGEGGGEGEGGPRGGRRGGGMGGEGGPRGGGMGGGMGGGGQP